MYAIGEAKYDRSSLCAMARMLFMRGVSCGPCRRRRRRRRLGRVRVLGREREEDLFEADARRPQLQQPPPARDDGPREIAADVEAGLGFHFIADGAAAAVRFDDG